MTGRRWKIYLIEFETGEQYVGRTTKPVATRVQEHAASTRSGGRPPGCSNTRLWARLAGGWAHTVTTLHTTGSREKAVALERLETQRLGMPLNITNARSSSGRCTDGRHGRAEPTDRPMTCSVCRRRQRAENFGIDRWRSAGRSSRCKQCLRMLNRWRDRALALGYSQLRVRRIVRAHIFRCILEGRPHPATRDIVLPRGRGAKLSQHRRQLRAVLATWEI